MPKNANPHGRLSKKRKTKEIPFPDDGCDSSFVSGSKELLSKVRHEDHSLNDKVVPKVKLPEVINSPLRHPDEGLALKSPTGKLLKEHMESILSEVKEAREKLFQWWRQEIQIIIASAGQRRECDTDAEKRQEQAENVTSKDHTSMQAKSKDGQVFEKNIYDTYHHEPSKLQIDVEAVKGSAHDMGNSEKRSCELLSLHPKPSVIDGINRTGSGSTRKTPKELLQDPDRELHQGSSVNSNDKAGLKEVVPTAMNKPLGESKNVLFDMCFGAEIGNDVKDVEGLDDTLDSDVTMREGFEFSKASNEIQKGLDRLDRLRETKSTLLDMGFDDDESNEGNGVGCSLESAASSKVKSGFSKTSGMHSSFDKGSGASFGAPYGQHGKDYVDSNGVLEGAATYTNIYVPTKAKKEAFLEEEKQATVKEGLVGARDGRLDDGRHVDCIMGVKAGQALIKESYNANNSLAPVIQPKDVQQQVGIGTRSDLGNKRSYATAMTFKGSALECRKDMFQQRNYFADGFNSATSSILEMDSVHQPPAGDKGKMSLSLPNSTNAFGVTGTAATTSLWNMHTSCKNGVNQTLQDSKIVNLEFASRSNLGDALVDSGRTLDFPGFDPVPGYASHFKAGTEMMNVYQPERGNTNSMYFSSLCTNNSVYLPTSDRLISMQRSPPSASPMPYAGSWSRLMGVTDHVGGQHDPSSMHTFLGLGMNGVPGAASGMQGFPGLYPQSNQQHNQASFKNNAQSTAPMVSRQESSAVQEKAILELNF